MTHKRFDLLLTELENIENQVIHLRDSLLRARAAEATRMLRSELDQAQQSPKVAPTVAIDERAEFEKWANKHKGGEPLQLGDGGTYPNPFANAAFEAWQARAKLSAPKVASKTTDTIVPDAKDEIDHEGIWTNSDVAEQRYIQGWNDCRAAMQANCDAMLKGEK